MTKITLNLSDLLYVKLGDMTIDMPIAECRAHYLEEENIQGPQLDLEEALHANRMIGRFWTTEDVQREHPELTDDQAWQVLQLVNTRLVTPDADFVKCVRDVAELQFPAPKHTSEPEFPQTLEPSRSDQATVSVGDQS